MIEFVNPEPLDSIQNVLLNTYQKMIEDGTVEKIAREQIANMINGTLHDAMSWNGPVKAAFKERVEPLMIEAVERSELESMTEKLTGVINRALNDSAVGSYKMMLKGIEDLCGAPTFKLYQHLKLSDIFKAYVKSCERAFSDVYFDKDDLERDEDGRYHVLITCSMEVEREKRYFGDGDYTITFAPSCEDLQESESDEIIKNTFCVKIHEYQSYGENGKKRLMWFGTLDAMTLRHLPEFAVFLQAAKDAFCSIDIDCGDGCDEIEVEFDE